MKKTIILLVILALSIITVHADTTVLQPGTEGKDAWVLEPTDDTNYGTSPYLLGRYGINARNMYGLIEFDLSSLSGASISSTTLSLYHDMGASEGKSLSLYRITSPWDEGLVTWNTQPTMDSTPVATLTLDNSINTWREWDVTSLVQGWIDGSYSNYGMAIFADATDGIREPYLWSSDYENDASLRPKLTVTVAVVPEPVSSTLFLIGGATLGFRRFRKNRK